MASLFCLVWFHYHSFWTCHWHIILESVSFMEQFIKSEPATECPLSRIYEPSSSWDFWNIQVGSSSLTHLPCWMNTLCQTKLPWAACYPMVTSILLPPLLHLHQTTELTRTSLDLERGTWRRCAWSKTESSTNDEGTAGCLQGKQ